MTRLTNYLRDEITKNAIAKTSFQSEMDALAKERYELAEEIRIESLGGRNRADEIEATVAKIEKLAKLLPEEIVAGTWIRRDYEMYRLNLGGLRANIKFSDCYEDLRICASGVTLTADNPLTVRFNEIINKESDIEGRRNDLALQVRAVLNTCSTVKKLLTVWPEAKELLPDRLEEARPQLPAVQTQELNAAIGLPTE